MNQLQRFVTCPDCGGSGKVDEIFKVRVGREIYSRVLGKKTCGKCKGEGTIDLLEAAWRRIKLCFLSLAVGLILIAGFAILVAGPEALVLFIILVCFLIAGSSLVFAPSKDLALVNLLSEEKRKNDDSNLVSDQGGEEVPLSEEADAQSSSEQH